MSLSSQKPRNMMSYFETIYGMEVLRKQMIFLLKSCGDISIAPLTKEIEDIKEKLKLLQALLTYIAEAYFSGENRERLTSLRALLDEAACLQYSCLVDKIDDEMVLEMKRKLVELLGKINVHKIYMEILKASYTRGLTTNLESEFYLLNNLIKLLETNDKSVSFLNDQSEELRSKLEGLLLFLVALPHDQRIEKLNYLVSSIEAIAWKSIPILYSCLHEEMEEDMATEVNGALTEVLDRIKHIQVEVRQIKLYCYPKTDELGFLDRFWGRMDELLECRPEMIESLRNQIETLHLEFDFFRSFLRAIKEHHDENQELEDLQTDIIRLAYRAENVIDFYLVNYGPDSRVMSSLSEIVDQTKLIKSKVKMINVKKTYRTQAHDVANSSSSLPSQGTGSGDEVVVGFKDEAEKIMEYLHADLKKLDVVSIVGMAGLGKTTLAKKMYEATSTIDHFNVRAWCSVSQAHQRRNLLLAILGGVIGITDEINRLNDEELAAELCKTLRGRRYLVVIDDLWDIMAWNDLKRSFPDDRNRSRILVTSRYQNVALQIEANGKVHTLRQFSDDESWELFRTKLLQNDSFSQEFLDVGRQIAQSCKGLPLAIVVIAGVLSKVEKNIHKWKEIAVSLNSHILSDSENQCKAILELSYKHLPDHLKSCFLYTGAFPKDKEIPVRKLKWLWMAEGFVRDTTGKSLEVVAEDYFMDLISRSLVTATRERSHGGVKACRVHNLLHEFCLGKAKEESFLQMIDLDNWSTFSRVYDEHRLSVYPDVYALMKKKPSSCSVRSLLHTANNGNSSHQDTSFIFQNFKLLRVLDTACTNMEKSFNGIESLIHLRYLAVQSRITSIPSSIANLWNLQFFLVKANDDDGYSKEVVDVPDFLWDMVNLRHVHINHRAFFNVDPKRPENSSLLDNLETLSTPCLSNVEEAENLLRRLPKLRKLRCIFVDCWEGSKKCYQFPRLEFLDQLISLKVFFKGPIEWGENDEFNFPPNLEKLTLSNFFISWNDISRIGRALPNLKVLKLTANDKDKKWIVNDADFPKLKYLKLCRTRYAREWIASEDSFPNLEQLVLDDCKDLTEIPQRFEEIPTLRMITVKSCNSTVNDSARRIQMNQQEEMQNDVKVYIYPRNLLSSF